MASMRGLLLVHRRCVASANVSSSRVSVAIYNYPLFSPPTIYPPISIFACTAKRRYPLVGFGKGGKGRGDMGVITLPVRC